MCKTQDGLHGDHFAGKLQTATSFTAYDISNSVISFRSFEITDEAVYD